MDDMRRRKTIVVITIVATSILPLVFLRLDEARLDLNVYKHETEALEHVRVIHVLSDEKDYPGETGYITTDLLKKYLAQDLPEYEFLICGPPAMTSKLEASLLEEGVPREQIHHELFSF